MLWVQMILYFAVSFLASVAGAICGIGGGILVKPTLDLFGFDSVAVSVYLLRACSIVLPISALVLPSSRSDAPEVYTASLTRSPSLDSSEISKSSPSNLHVFSISSYSSLEYRLLLRRLVNAKRCRAFLG